MDEDVEPELLLEGDDIGDLALNAGAVVGVAESTLRAGRARLADVGGLRERADGPKPLTDRVWLPNAMDTM